jgi:hypothetical protein
MIGSESDLILLIDLIQECSWFIISLIFHDSFVDRIENSESWPDS